MRLYRIGERPGAMVLVTFAETKVTRARARKLLIEACLQLLAAATAKAFA
jgi:hypothetical protein